MSELDPSLHLPGYMVDSYVATRVARFIEGSHKFLPELMVPGYTSRIESLPQIGVVVLRNFFDFSVTDELSSVAKTLDYEDWPGGHGLAPDFPLERSNVATALVHAASHGWSQQPVFAVNRYRKSGKDPVPHVDKRTLAPVILQTSGSEGGVVVHTLPRAGTGLFYRRQEKDFAKRRNIVSVPYGPTDVLVMSGTTRMHRGETTGPERFTYLHYLHELPY